jgi:uncharacterized alkaline shock family protein YloU
MAGQASISTDILARYAADAAGEVIGVRGLSESSIPGRRGGVRVSSDDAGVRVALHLVVDWGASVPSVGHEVQERVREYLLRMADVEPTSVDVVVEEIGPRQ